MTNEQIITEIAMQVYGEDTVMEMIQNGIEIPLHTLQGWASRGSYKVKAGEHGIETRLWKKKKKKDFRNEEVNENSDKDKEELPVNRDFYLCKSFLFRYDQVEKVEEKSNGSDHL